MYQRAKVYILKYWLHVLCITALVITVYNLNLFDDYTSGQCSTLISECEALTVPSRVECKQAEGPLAKYPFTQSCLYHNIYFIRGTPTLFLTKLSNESFETMENRDQNVDFFNPTRFVFTSAKDLCQKHCIRFHDDVSVLGDIWMGNIGHTLFDSLYAIFASLTEYSHLHLKPFRIINTRTQTDVPWIGGVMDTAAPLGLVYSANFFHKSDVVFLRKLLLPNYARCIMCITSDRYYGVSMGYEIFPLLRQHLLTRFSVSARGVQASLVIAVHNKRFTRNDYIALEGALHSVAGRLVDWSGMDFRLQLQLISNTKIHLSAPGTAMMYQPFLPDGAVHVNLGACTRYQYQTTVWAAILSLYYPGYTDPIQGYMEQSMVASTSYQRALYYPANEICGGLTRVRLLFLLQQAEAIYASNFSIPVARGVNLSPEGRIVQALLRTDPVFREHIANSVAHKECATGRYIWPEIIVREQGGWATGECRLNRTRLGELKQIYLNADPAFRK